ncbi:MAG TPA: hypothetical protein VEH26_04120 [Chthoniobacterales bacterium]|nr:hypothetical protein [Chthoniobacterales bacterium]
MRYLVVDADYRGTGIRDEFTGQITPESVGLPQDLVERITKWVADYQPIIPVPSRERWKRSGEIEKLDEIGLDLARAVEGHFGAGARVKYFSEGKLKQMLI